MRGISFGAWALISLVILIHCVNGMQHSPLRSKVPPFPPKGDEQRTTFDMQALSSRKGFIRKVYGIFSTQMLCTIVTTAMIMQHPSWARYLQRNFDKVSLSSFGIATSIALILVRFPSIRHQPTRSLPLVLIHAISQSLMIGTIAR